VRRERRLLWTVVGVVVAAVVVGLALIHRGSDASPGAASSPAPPTAGSAGPPVAGSAPVIVPKSSTSSVSYLSDLRPRAALSGTVTRGPAEISGSIYPKSISFYCNVGDPTPFPVYRLAPNAHRFQATIGLTAKARPEFQAGILLVGDGRTVRMLSVNAGRPRTVDVDVTGIHALQLECFGSGNSATGGEAVAVAWGNARISAGR
jgi:hypothetical protein